MGPERGNTDLEKFLKQDISQKIVAERARFELARALRPYMRSRHADSTTLPSLRVWDFLLSQPT